MKGEHEEINDENVSWTKDNNSSNFVYLSSNEREREKCVTHGKWWYIHAEEPCYQINIVFLLDVVILFQQKSSVTLSQY